MLPNGVAVDGTPDEHSLIVRGWQRAGALVTFFAPTNDVARNAAIATPHFIFAVNGQTTAKSLPLKETVSPLVSKLDRKTVANFDFGVGQESEVAAALSQCDGVVRKAEHHNIPIHRQLFPCQPQQ